MHCLNGIAQGSSALWTPAGAMALGSVQLDLSAWRSDWTRSAGTGGIGMLFA